MRQQNHIIIKTQSQPKPQLEPHQSQSQTSSASSFNQGNNSVASQQFHHRLRNRTANNRDNSSSPCSYDIMMSHSLNASSGSLSSVSDRSASTDCVEEYVTDVPFAGKFCIIILISQCTLIGNIMISKSSKSKPFDFISAFVQIQ